MKLSVYSQIFCIYFINVINQYLKQFTALFKFQTIAR